MLKIWVDSENPNSDVNVPLSEAVKWFRNSNKKILMDEEDFKVYESFPEKVKLYRGITKFGNPYGLSWTTNLDTAKWFANRFNINDRDNGNYVIEAEVNKEDILAYFSGRNENEVIVDTSNILFKKLVDN